MHIRPLKEADWDNFRTYHYMQQLDRECYLDGDMTNMLILGGLKDYATAEAIVKHCENITNIDLANEQQRHLLTLTYNYVLDEKTYDDWKHLPIAEQANLLALMSGAVYLSNQEDLFRKTAIESSGVFIKVCNIMLSAVGAPVPVRAVLSFGRLGCDLAAKTIDLSDGITKEVLSARFSEDLFTSEHYLKGNYFLSRSAENFVTKKIIAKRMHDDVARASDQRQVVEHALLAKTEEIMNELTELKERTSAYLEKVTQSKQKLQQTVSNTRDTAVKIVRYANVIADAVYRYTNIKHNQERQQDAKRALVEQLQQAYDLHAFRLNLKNCDTRYYSLPAIRHEVASQMTTFAYINTCKQERYFESVLTRIDTLKAHLATLADHRTDLSANIGELQQQQIKYSRLIKGIKQNEFLAYAQGALGIAATLSMANPLTAGVCALGNTALGILASRDQRVKERRSNCYRKQIQDINAHIERTDLLDREYRQMEKGLDDNIELLEKFLLNQEKQVNPVLRRKRLVLEHQNQINTRERLLTEKNTLGSSEELNKQKLEVIALRDQTKPKKMKKLNALNNELTIITNKLQRIAAIDVELATLNDAIPTLEDAIQHENNPHVKAAKDWWYERRVELANAQFAGLTAEEIKAKENLLVAHKLMISAYEEEVALRQYRTQAVNGTLTAATKLFQGLQPLLGIKPLTAIKLVQVAYEANEAYHLIWQHVLPKFSAQIENPKDIYAWMSALQQHRLNPLEFLKEFINPSLTSLANMVTLGVSILGYNVRDVDRLLAAMQQLGTGIHKHLREGFQTLEKSLNDVKQQVAAVDEHVLVAQHTLVSLLDYQYASTHNDFRTVINQQTQQQTHLISEKLQAFYQHIESKIMKINDILPKVLALQSVDHRRMSKYVGLMQKYLTEDAKLYSYSGTIEFELLQQSIAINDVRYFMGVLAKRFGYKESLIQLYIIMQALPTFGRAISHYMSILNAQALETGKQEISKTEAHFIQTSMTCINTIEQVIQPVHDFLENIMHDNAWFFARVEQTYSIYRELNKLILRKQAICLDELKQVTVKRNQQKNYQAYVSRLNDKSLFVGSQKYYMAELITARFADYSEGLVPSLSIVLESFWGSSLLSFGLTSLHKWYLITTGFNASLQQLLHEQRYDCIAYNLFLRIAAEEYKVNEDTLYLDPQNKQFRFVRNLPEHAKIPNSPIQIHFKKCNEEVGYNTLTFLSPHPALVMVDGNPLKTETTLTINNHPVDLQRLQQVRNPHPDILLALEYTMEAEAISARHAQYDIAMSTFMHSFAMLLMQGGTCFNSVSLNDTHLLEPANKMTLPVHLPIPMADLKKNALLATLFEAEAFGLATLTFNYKLVKCYDEAALYQIVLTINAMDIQQKEYEIADVVLTRFDYVTVEAFKKLILVKDNYTYKKNFNEFLLLAIYGTVPHIGFTAKGSIDLDGIGTICPVDLPFPGSIRVLRRLTFDHLFHFDHNYYDEAASKALFAYCETGEVSPAITPFFKVRSDNTISLRPGYYQFIAKTESLYRDFYQIHVQQDAHYQAQLHNLERCYHELCTAFQLIKQIDCESMNILLEDNLNIFHPYFLRELAAANFLAFKTLIQSAIPEEREAACEQATIELFNWIAALDDSTPQQLKDMLIYLDQLQTMLQGYVSRQAPLQQPIISTQLQADQPDVGLKTRLDRKLAEFLTKASDRNDLPAISTLLPFGLLSQAAVNKKGMQAVAEPLAAIQGIKNQL